MNAQATKSESSADTFASALSELMTKWDISRAKCIETFGSDNGFAEWFTKQVGL
jgi:hypothetical protein